MPPIYRFKCNNCGFRLPSGWGSYMYLEDANGIRHICPHPNERRTLERLLSKMRPQELKRSRSGFNSSCLCLDCLHQFDIDLERDKKRCPICCSDNIRTELDLVGKQCPKCKEGSIQIKEIGYA